MNTYPLLRCTGVVLAAVTLLCACARDGTGAIVHTPPAASQPAASDTPAKKN